MRDIKIKQKNNTGVKVLDKTITWTERVKDPILDVKEKNSPIQNNDSNNVEYADNKIKYMSNRVKDETFHQGRKLASKTKDRMIKNVEKVKSNKPKIIKQDKINTKANINKVVKDTPKNAERMKKAAMKTKQVVQKTGKAIASATKKIGKALVSSVKALISGLSSLIGLIAGGGIVAVVVVVIICLVGLLCTSIFGIFFSGESKSRTMNSVVTQINNEIYQKAENERLLTPNSEIVIDSTVTNWREVIAVYSVKYSNSEESDIIMYINEKNISNIRRVFNDFNKVSLSKATSSGYLMATDGKFVGYYNGNNTSSTSDNDSSKTIIHLSVNSKSLDDVMNQYKFTEEQKKNTRELLDSKYDDLWNRLLYGSNVGDFINWSQKNEVWANTPIGSSGKTLGQIGCLATSISILVEKSGAGKTISPFNPQTFVEKMNENGGFDSNGNLQYGAISKFIPTFSYAGRISLKDKTKIEKYQLINKYHSRGYYLAVEVKGDTGQHWVAVIETSGGNITMADPGSDETNLWGKYDWKNSSQFVYFKAQG